MPPRNLPSRARSFVWVLASLVLPLLAARPAAAFCPRILFDEATPGTVYVGYFSVGALMKSTDNGRTWNNTGARAWATFGPLVIEPKNSRTLYAGASGGVMKSTDGGETWARSGLSGRIIDALAIDRRTPSLLFARASRDNSDGWPGEVYKSADGGAQWTLANAGLPKRGVTLIRFSRNNSNVLYAGATSGLFKTTDGGKRWTRLKSGIGERTIVNLAFDASDPETLYVAASRKSESGVFKSTNGGVTWTTVSTGLPAGELMELAGDPSRPGIVYAGVKEKGLYRTTDAGANWAPVGLRNGYPCDVAVSPHDPNVILVATTGDANRGYVRVIHRSSDGGTKWEALGDGLPSVSSIAERRSGERDALTASLSRGRNQRASASRSTSNPFVRAIARAAASFSSSRRGVRERIHR